MDLRQLHSFLAVVDQGSFSRAAATLFTVQSNVSSHVAHLEAELGVTLLDRRTRQLTAAGRVVEQHGREIVRQLTAIGDDLAALENRIIGSVTIGVTPSIGLRVIPTVLARAARELPDVSVSVVEAFSGTLVQQLLSGEVDMAITTGAGNLELVSTPLFDEDIVAVLAPDHPLAGKEALTLRDLATQRLLMPLPDNPLYGQIAETFERANLALRVGLEVGSSALVRALASAGVGVAVIPATAASDGAPEDGAVVRPIESMPPRHVALTTRRVHTASRALQAIHDIVEDVAGHMAPLMPGCRVAMLDPVV